MPYCGKIEHYSRNQMNMEDKFPKIIGDAIRKERKSHSLSQQELADFSGTGLNFVSQLERGKSSVRFDKLLDVMRVLGLSFSIQSGKERISSKK